MGELSLQQEIDKDPLGGALGAGSRGTKTTGMQAGIGGESRLGDVAGEALMGLTGGWDAGVGRDMSPSKC